MCSAARVDAYLTATFLCFVLLTCTQAIAQTEEDMPVAVARPHIPAGESAKRRVRIRHTANLNLHHVAFTRRLEFWLICPINGDYVRVLPEDSNGRFPERDRLEAGSLSKTQVSCYLLYLLTVLTMSVLREPRLPAVWHRETPATLIPKV